MLPGQRCLGNINNQLINKSQTDTMVVAEIVSAIAGILSILSIISLKMSLANRMSYTDALISNKKTN
jgi:hypothetical protein